MMENLIIFQAADSAYIVALCILLLYFGFYKQRVYKLHIYKTGKRAMTASVNLYARVRCERKM